MRGSDLQAGLSLKTPELGATFLTGLFDKLAVDLSDYPVMVMRDAYFRLRSRPTASSAPEKALAKKEGSGAKAERPAAAAVTPPADKKEPSSRPCVGNLGSLLGAVNKDGRPYSCKFGGDCAFDHMTLAGKSKQRLLDIVGSLTATPRADLTRAVMSRS